MSVKLIDLGPRWTRVALAALALLCVILAWFFIRWNLANVMASRVDPQRPESAMIADWLTQLAPSDPEARLLAGEVFEKTFDPEDLKRAALEYELATALSPYDYRMWMNLGKVRRQNGDIDGAQKAYKRALELAPNYAGLHWLYGNTLIRDGATDEGFGFIARAAAENAEYAGPAVLTALQIFEGDVDQVRQSMGDHEQVNQGLVSVLSAQGAYPRAFEAWSRLPVEMRRSKYKTLGESLAAQMTEKGPYRLAVKVHADVTADEIKPAAGTVTNGGFEGVVKPRDAGIFEWRISDGSHPQIGLSDGTKRSGQYSLLLLFNSFDTAGMRSLEQTIAVEPGVDHELVIYYQSDIRSAGVLKFEVLDAATLARLAVSGPLGPAANWTEVRVGFRTTDGTDGVRIRLLREGCSGPTCPMSGRLFLDDISLRSL